MPPDEQFLDDIAGAVLDGDTVDWSSAESTAQDTAKQLLPHLRLVASVAGALSSTPDHWGHLRLIEPIGRGTFGEVFRAWDTRLDRDVALAALERTPPAERPELYGGGHAAERVRDAVSAYTARV